MYSHDERDGPGDRKLNVHQAVCLVSLLVSTTAHHKPRGNDRGERQKWLRWLKLAFAWLHLHREHVTGP